MVLLLSAAAALLALLALLRITRRLAPRRSASLPILASRNVPKSCPHLGLASDPFEHDSHPTEDHRCYLWMQRDRIDVLHQSGFCLSGNHQHCPWLMVRRPTAQPAAARLPGLALGAPRRAWALASAPMMRLRAGRAERRARPAAAVTSVAHAGPGSAPPAAVSPAPHPAAAATDGAGAPAGMPWEAWLVASETSDAAARLTTPRRRGLAGAGSAAAAVLRKRLDPAGRRARVMAVALVRLLAAAGSYALARSGRGGRALARFSWRAVVVLARLLRRHGPPAMAAAGRGLLLASRLLLKSVAWLAVRLWRLLRSTARLVRARLEARPKAATGAAMPVASSTEVDQAESAEESVAASAPVLAGALEELISEGLATLDRGEESLAYHLFVTATEQRAPRGLAAADYAELMKRAWFWRAKTAETVEDVVASLVKALELDPGNLQMQAHLAWAKQRLEREQKIKAGPAASASSAAPLPVYQVPFPPAPSLGARLGEAVRLAGGLAALAFAALWMTSGMVPALGRALAGLPPADQSLIHELVLSINRAALPGQGHLALPVLDYDVGLSIPFVLGFLFVFTARGLMDGDPWARKTGLALTGVAAWLCLSAVSNPDAARVGLVLCGSIGFAVILGRFNHPKLLSIAERS